MLGPRRRSGLTNLLLDTFILNVDDEDEAIPGNKFKIDTLGTCDEHIEFVNVSHRSVISSGYFSRVV